MKFHEQDRRRFIASTLAAGAALPFGGIAINAIGKEKNEEEEVTPNEDLMREHGLLDRVLLIYEENLKRAAGGGPLVPKALHSSAEIIRDFIESYHEKLEEEFLFPILVKAKREVDLVSVLKDQHEVGRKLTNQIISLSKRSSKDDQIKLQDHLKAFISMYRAHASREDTVLFPAFKESVGEKKYKELGELFEEREHKLFGEGGFKSVLMRVEKIEVELGIHDLKGYTPKL